MAAGWPLFFIFLVVFSAVFIASSIFARAVLLADKPNGRSSHLLPVSRAGGIAILFGWCLGLLLSTWLLKDVSLSIHVFSLVVLAVCLGLLDDIFQLRPLVKFIGQFLLAVSFVSLAGAIQIVPIPLFGEGDIGGLLATPLSVFWILGMMNAYNFMDGANGLAAGVGSLVLMIIAIFAGVSGELSLTVAAFSLAVALAAFLPHNLLRGKIFMGDSGSQGVSFAIAAFAILLSRGGEAPIISALLVPVLMLPFIADVAFTLAHRLHRRQNLAQAHREHVYQLLMRQGLSHGDVCGIYVGATALCAVAGILMLKISSGWQWLVPVFLLILLGWAGMIVFRRANKAGFLPMRQSQDISESDVNSESRKEVTQAAE